MVQTHVLRSVEVAGLSRAERIAALKEHLVTMDPRAGTASGLKQADYSDPSLNPIATHPGLAQALRGGGLPRRAVVNMSTSSLLASVLIEHATQAGSLVAVVGWPELSFADIEHLERIVAIPDPGQDPWQIAALLCEGIDLVIVNTPIQMNLGSSRAFMAKVRKGKAGVLNASSHQIPATLALQPKINAFYGIGPGVGRIRGIDLAVQVNYGNAQERRTTVAIGDTAGPQLRVV